MFKIVRLIVVDRVSNTGRGVVAGVALFSSADSVVSCEIEVGSDACAYECHFDISPRIRA